MHSVPVPEGFVDQRALHSRLRHNDSQVGVEVAVFLGRLPRLPDSRLDKLGRGQLLPQKRHNVGLNRSRLPHGDWLLRFVEAQVPHGGIAELVHLRGPVSVIAPTRTHPQPLREADAILRRVAGVAPPGNRAQFRGEAGEFAGAFVEWHELDAGPRIGSLHFVVVRHLEWKRVIAGVHVEVDSAGRLGLETHVSVDRRDKRESARHKPLCRFLERCWKLRLEIDRLPDLVQHGQKVLVGRIVRRVRIHGPDVGNVRHNLAERPLLPIHVDVRTRLVQIVGGFPGNHVDGRADIAGRKQSRIVLLPGRHYFVDPAHLVRGLCIARGRLPMLLVIVIRHQTVASASLPTRFTSSSANPRRLPLYCAGPIKSSLRSITRLDRLRSGSVTSIR